ncbi:lantibiotic dehydratase [Actinoplanes sichuanensis]|uniref:Lantibiotic dehydratase n=1 Tax=Actinoplanes sichuanensis TaxID=512349 RepID=A0ABW4AKR0_9ACTN|nr:lantibiotic dehydratase [Actinoplanes sichuanensis]BEL06124.1 lantibiotic dehydratase [Actinoplanes sichuanensis]
MTFSPYVLFRRGTLPYSALTGLVPTQTWALLDEADHHDRQRTALAADLEQALHDAIPDLPPTDRAAALAVRRAVHNDRPLPKPPATLPHSCREQADQWARSRQRSADLRAEAQTCHDGELDTARKVLAEVARTPDFQAGLQLSGADLHREVSAYAADPYDRRRKAARRRRAESTIVSYAYRVALKPSPFGTFTEIGAHPWTGHPGGTGGRVSTARLNLGLVAWLADALRRVDGADRLFRIRLNHTLTVDGDRVLFLRPLDRVVSARYGDLVRLLQQTLGDDGLPEHELHRLLPADTVDNLVKLGLCHRDLGLPDQTLRPAEAVADLVRPILGERHADGFDRLQRIEDEFAGADVARRAVLLDDLTDQVQRISGEPPQAEAMRAAIYEDVGTHAPSATWRPDVLEANRDGLALFQRLLPLLDDATMTRLGLYRLFTRTFGTAAGPVDLLRFYQVFDALTPDETAALMTGADDPHAVLIRRHRTDFYRRLQDGRLGATDGDRILVDPRLLHDFLAGLPTASPAWRSTAYRVQFGTADGQTLAVVNGVTTGHGVFFSRFCDLLRRTGPGDWDLGTAVGAHLHRTGPRQTDITATLGLNFNLHPRLTPYELLYPGSVARPAATGVLTLADVTVVADPDRRRLRLLSRRDGAPLDLVPLNFLYPAAAPPPYRFLCGFAPTRTYRGGLWEQTDRAHPHDAPPHRPRVMLGDLVLDRRTWRIPIDELPRPDGLDAFDRWWRGRGLPRTAFFRIVAPPPDGPRDLISETRRWALEARTARLHKPHFLDVRNPFLLSVLDRQARACPDGSLMVQECLPAVGKDAAEEFFVEHDLDGDHADD